MSNCQIVKTYLLCEIVSRTFWKQKNVDLDKSYVLNLIYKDNFALKYQLNKDQFPCSIKIVKVTYITI